MIQTHQTHPETDVIVNPFCTSPSFQRHPGQDEQQSAQWRSHPHSSRKHIKKERRMNYTIQRHLSNDVASRILELELSQELHDIYCHPHWIEFMDMLSHTTCEASLYTLRRWAESHYQLAPLIEWFHSCTGKYGLCFDIYSYIPPSRLILHKRCQEKILHYEALLRKCESKLVYYQELEQMLVGGPDYHSDESSPSSAPTSCWSILTSHTSLITGNGEYSIESNAVQNAPFRPCAPRKNPVTLPPLEAIYLPDALNLDVRP